jgi:leukotriene-A4 hydrolase
MTLVKFNIKIANKWTTAAINNRDDLFNNRLSENFPVVFKKWHTDVKLEFLNKVMEKINSLTDEQYNTLRDRLGLHKGYNMEVSNIWYQIALLTKHTDVYPYVDEFLGQIGRLRYIRPIYEAYARLDMKRAYSVFTQQKYIII